MTTTTTTQPLPSPLAHPLTLSALALGQAIANQHVSATAVVQAALHHVALHDEALGCFTSQCEDLALQQAAAVDAQVAAGQPLASPLAGVPVGVKDNLSLVGTTTTCSSRMLKDYVAPYTATTVQRLLNAGLCPVGKTNMDEFAMGSSTETSAFFPTKNPWHTQRVPGGSSGGSAACVAAGMVPLSLGSDTGGSVRQPASLCGLVGLKPTYGLVSRYGLVAFASSLDQVSPFSRTVADSAALLQLIAGRDEADMTSYAAPAVLPNYLEATRPEALSGLLLNRPLRIGVIEELKGDGMQSEVREAFEQSLQQWQAAGAQVQTVSIPGIKEAIAAYYIIAPAEASSNLSRFDGIRYGHRSELAVKDVADLFCKSRAEGFGPEVKRRILLGTFALSSGYYDAYYGKAQAARRYLQQSFNKAWAQVDVLVSPTAPTTAFELGAQMDDPITMYLNDVATIPANLAGLPALSLPCGADALGLPIGLQLMAPAWQEPLLFAAAAQLEALLDGYANQIAPAFTPV